MEIELHSPDFRPVQLRASLPQDYRDFVLRGSTIFSVNDSNKLIVVQEIHDEAFSISFHTYDLESAAKIPVKQEGKVLIALLAIRSAIQYVMKGIGKINLLPGEFSLFQTKGDQGVIQFERAGEYEHFEVSWSEGIVEQAIHFFPEIENTFHTTQQEPRNQFVIPNQLASANTIDIARSILQSPYDAKLSHLFYQNKVREYLFSLLYDATRIPPQKIHVSKRVEQKIMQIAEHMKSHPEERFLISDLAKEAGINEMKLKSIFKEIFRMGIFEYHLDQRMKESMKLLKETNLSLKEIASRVGYRLTTSFITKFREFHGYPPSRVRPDR